MFIRYLFAKRSNRRGGDFAATDLRAEHLVHRFDQLTHVADRTLERLLFGCRQLDLDDPFDPVAADHYRHAGVQAAHAVFAFEIRGAWEHFLAVERERLDHPVNRRPRRVVRRRLHQVDDLAAAVARALFDFIEPLGIYHALDRYAAAGRVAADGHHVVAMPTEHHRLYALDRDVEFAREKR